jgi:hypothetical protein
MGAGEADREIVGLAVVVFVISPDKADQRRHKSRLAATIGGPQ